MLGVKTIEFFSRRIYMKIDFSSQKREMLFFLTTNMAAVMSLKTSNNMNSNFPASAEKSR